MLSTNKVIYLEDIFCYKDCVSSVRTTTYVCNRFNTSFCATHHQTNQAISNLNRKFWDKSMLIWVGFLVVHCYPLCSSKTTSLKVFHFYLHLNSHTYLTSCIYNFFDQTLFYQKFEHEKEVYIKVFLNQFMFILICYLK